MTRDEFIEDLLHKLAGDSKNELSYQELRRMFHNSIPMPLHCLEQAYKEGYKEARDKTTQCSRCGYVHSIREE